MAKEDTSGFNILYVDDEENNLVSFRAALRRHYNVFTAISGEEGMKVVAENDIHVIVTDQRMPGMTGVQFLQKLPDEPDSVRMILTGFSDIEAIIEAINTGRVYRYITKPWDKDELKITIDNALEAVILRRDNKSLISELKIHNEQLEEKVKLRTLEIENKSLLLETEMAKADKLLLNILPEEIASELKKFGKSYARKYDQVSVLFTDIAGFTSIAEKMAPDELVAQLDDSFRGFDRIIKKYDIEKIKTIGDSYMCVCGLPTSVENQAQVLTNAALDMQEFMSGFNTSKRIQNLPQFKIRMGIHTGPVVAGVVGLTKFAYDIWGDTVNLAAQLEQKSEPGKVNISQRTYALIKDHFHCSHRGKLSVKNKGEVDMYFVDRKS